jgi:hypothetical protein
LIWNDSGSQWNDGKFWAHSQPGASFLSSSFWRVLNVKRKTDGEKMQIELVQYKSDDEV